MNRADHRQTYYERYVSAFKGPARAQDWPYARYRAWCDAHFGPWFSEVDKALPVLELGCGAGAMLTYLHEHGFRSVEGIDISNEQVDLAQRRGAPARVADAFAALDVPSATLGGVVALDFIEHFTKAEIVDLLPRIAMALIPGGFLLLQTPNGAGINARSLIYGDLTHATIFTPASLRQALLPVGFKDVRFREATFATDSARQRVRSVAWHSIRAAAQLVHLIQTGGRQEIWSANLVCFARLRPA